MSTPVINSHMLRLLSAAISEAYSTDLMEWGWRSVGIPPHAIDGPPFFLPYQIEAEMLENLARHLGQRHLGAVTSTYLKYSDLGLYGRYVLSAPDLGVAFFRGDRALPFIQNCSAVHFGETGNHVVLGFSSGIEGVLGARHLSEAMPLLLRDLIRHFLGASWEPAWIELPFPKPKHAGILEQVYGVPVVWESAQSAIAIEKTALSTPNPAGSSDVKSMTVFGDLRQMIDTGQPRTESAVVADMIRLQIAMGGVSEESVAERLGVGIRTLQRRLQSEGSSFRDLLNRETSRRAVALLTETNAPVSSIAQALGYSEVNSFRRAFRDQVGLSPSQFRRV